MDKAVVLFSSGLDSTVNLYEAHAQLEVVKVLFFDYGQRALAKEEENARKQVEYLGLDFLKIQLSFIKDFGGSSLIDENKEVAIDIEIDNLQASKQSAKNVWVPNRNGIFINVAAGYAESLGAKYIVPGFNKEEAASFPDNSEDFLNVSTDSLSYSTSNQVQVKCFTTSDNKAAIYRRGIELGVQYQYVWPCYFSGDEICGHCESCLRFQRAKREGV